MASIKTGSAISTIRGSIGGTVFSQNANGAYTRNRSKASNPNTSLQRAQRNSFGYCSRLWRGLTEDDQKTWISQAPNYPYVNRLGESSIYTGFQLFQKVNGRLIGIGETPINSIGSPVEVAPIVTFVVDTASVAGGLNFTFDFGLGTGVVPANTTCVVWATAFKSAGFYRPKKSDFRKAYSIAASSDASNTDFKAPFATVSGTASLGRIQYAQAQLVSTATGQVGATVWCKIVWAA
jgi:hypothetical protein